MAFDLSRNYNVNSSMPKSDYTKATLWKKTIQDPDYENGKNGARDIGTIINGRSRLNMITSLAKKDNEDWYSFNVVSKGKLRFSIKSYGSDTTSKDQSEDLGGLDASLDQAQEEADALRAKNLRVEIYREDRRGNLKLYASNDTEAGKLNEKFETLIKGEDKIKETGRMFVKISRLDPKKTDTVENYTIQVQMGESYKHDYVTIESQSQNTPEKGKNKVTTTAADIALENAAKSALITAGQSASDLLMTGAANLNSLRSKSKGSIFSLLV